MLIFNNFNIFFLDLTSLNTNISCDAIQKKEMVLLFLQVLIFEF